MVNSTFADGVSNIFVVNGVVRLELISSSIESDGKLKAISAGTLSIPLLGFANLYAQMDAAMKKMIEDGLLKTKPASVAEDSKKLTDLDQIKL